MRQVWKYPIGMGATVEMPVGARPVHVAVQHDSLNVWVEFDYEDDQEVKLEQRTFAVVGTGHPFSDGTHVASVLDGPFVWHVYER